MCAATQRVARTSADIEGTTVGEITGPEPMALPRVARDDGCEWVATLARRIVELRTLEGEHPVMEVDAPILVVSQFTLYGDTREGRRPSWSKVAPSEQAEPLANALVEDPYVHGFHAKTRVFDTVVEVSLANSGPFTVLVEA